MKRYPFPSLLALLALPLVLTSCIKDDDEDSGLSENCYISSVTLGTLKRSMYGKTTAGMDSLYTVTYAATAFPMTIDQRRDTIENLDSLPVRTRLERVAVTVAFESVLMWRKANLAGLADTTWTAYNSSDSLDLTEPIHLRVYSASGLSGRTYTLKVNVHQQNGDSTVWNNLGSVEALQGIAERRAVVWNNQLTVLGLDEHGALQCLTHPLSTTGTWTKQATKGAADARPTTLQRMGDALYMSAGSQGVITSQDGVEWTPLSMEETQMEDLTLAGASDSRLYALIDHSRLVRSSVGEDGSISWEAEELDDQAENLPTTELNSVYYTMKNGQKRLMLIGSRKTSDTSATIWAKSWAEGEEESAGWAYYTPNQADRYRCPMLEELCVVPYDGGMQALGGKSRDGRYAALNSVFHSADHGVTWKVYDDNEMDVDSNLQSAAQTAQHFAAAVDEYNFLWIVVDDKVWRGRINRLGFLRK